MSSRLFASTFIRSRSSNDSRLVTPVGCISCDSFLIEQVRIEHHPDMLIAGFSANLSHTGNLFQRLLDPPARQNRPSRAPPLRGAAAASDRPGDRERLIERFPRTGVSLNVLQPRSHFLTRGTPRAKSCPSVGYPIASAFRDRLELPSCMTKHDRISSCCALLFGIMRIELRTKAFIPITCEQQLI